MPEYHTRTGSAGDESILGDRKSQPNSVDGIEIFKNKSEKSNYLIIQKSKIASYEAYSLKKPKSNSSQFASPIKTPLKQLETRKTATTPTPQIRKPVGKKIEKISVKETMRDKEWLNKAKPQIIKDLALRLNSSNGMSLVVPTENYFTYKYYLGKGNNSALVKQLLSTRSWWTRITEEEMEGANLIWTQ